MTSPALQARYGAAAPDVAWPQHPVLDTLLGHRSVRSFLPDALPEGTIETLVAAAQSAPTSSNLQTWSVIAVQSPERRQQLAELTGPQRHLVQAPLVLVFVTDLSRIARLAQRQQRSVAGLGYMDSFLMGVIDAALAAQNAVVAAQALGLGTVYVGAMRNQPEAVAKVLHTPANVFPVFGLVVGHPDPAKPAAVKPRLPQSVVLHHETYHTPSDDAAELGDYNATLQAFQAREGMAAADWSAQVVDRLQDPAALKGRHRLFEALLGAGFRFTDVEQALAQHSA